MAEKIIFWIGAIAIGLNTIRFTNALMSVFLGWMLTKTGWLDYYIYFNECLSQKTTYEKDPNE